MASNTRFMPVPPEAVWDVLADPESYGYWVVGSKAIRDSDADWPSEGARFHHTIGIGFLKNSDHTAVIRAERPEVFVLRAKGRPLGTARVTMLMTAHPEGGTIVKMTETLDGVFAPLNLNPLVHLTTVARNAESLMRLEELALLRSDAAEAS
jgi:carbon monoxide dehydrogenase subunit G